MKRVSLLISVLSIFLLVGCDTNKPVNTPQETEKNSIVFKDRVVENLIIRNHNVAYYDNIYHVYLDIYNENNKPSEYSTITIKYYKDTALIYSTEEKIEIIPANGSTSISFDIDINLINANKVEYQLKK